MAHAPPPPSTLRQAMPRPRAQGRRCRRLRGLATALSAADSLPAPRRPVGEATAALLPLPLDTEGSGVDAQKLAEIVALQRRAVDEQDYRVAAELTDLLRVLQQPRRAGTARRSPATTLPSRRWRPRSAASSGTAS